MFYFIWWVFLYYVSCTKTLTLLLLLRFIIHDAEIPWVLIFESMFIHAFLFCSRKKALIYYFAPICQSLHTQTHFPSLISAKKKGRWRKGTEQTNIPTNYTRTKKRRTCQNLPHHINYNVKMLNCRILFMVYLSRPLPLHPFFQFSFNTVANILCSAPCVYMVVCYDLSLVSTRSHCFAV